jgi:hypothetical protein
MSENDHIQLRCSLTLATPSLYTQNRYCALNTVGLLTLLLCIFYASFPRSTSPLKYSVHITYCRQSRLLFFKSVTRMFLLGLQAAQHGTKPHWQKTNAQRETVRWILIFRFNATKLTFNWSIFKQFKSLLWATYPIVTSFRLIQVLLYLVSYHSVTSKEGSTCFILVTCLAYSSTLKMDVTCSSETSVDSQQTIWHYIPEARTLQRKC